MRPSNLRRCCVKGRNFRVHTLAWCDNWANCCARWNGRPCANSNSRALPNECGRLQQSNRQPRREQICRISAVQSEEESRLEKFRPTAGRRRNGLRWAAAQFRGRVSAPLAETLIGPRVSGLPGPPPNSQAWGDFVAQRPPNALEPIRAASVSSASSLSLSLRTSGVASSSAIAGHAICEGNTDRPRFRCRGGCLVREAGRGSDHAAAARGTLRSCAEDMSRLLRGNGHPDVSVASNGRGVLDCWITGLQRSWAATLT